MARIRDLPIEPSVARRWFAECGLYTTDDLWREIGTNLATGVPAVRAKTRITDHCLRQALLAAPERSARIAVTRGDLLLAALLLMLLLLAGFRVAEGVGLARFPVAALSARSEQAIVAPRDGLAAFHVLGERDLRFTSCTRIKGGAPRTAKLVGRYLLRPLAAGEVVREGDLSARPLPAGALTGRWIATLQVDPGTLGPQVVPGVEARIVLTGRAPTAASVATAGLILAVDSKGGWVTAALPQGNRGEVDSALGARASFLVRSDLSPGIPAATR